MVIMDINNDIKTTMTIIMKPANKTTKIHQHHELCHFTDHSYTAMTMTKCTQIPNQCIVYADDPDQKCRSEDANIAFTW